VNVPVTRVALNSHDLITLSSQVDPLKESEDGGQSLYTTVRSYVHARALVS